jgi:tetratricopeptide (TPR) repeat protein
MLESGSNFFACEVVSSLSENNVYQSYLARSEDGTSVRLLVSVALFVESEQHVLDLAQKWTSFDFTGAAVPLRVGLCDGRFVCTYPAFDGETLEASSLGHQLSSRYALEVLQSLTKLLVEPHKAGLIHGNISPTTIVLKGADLSLDGFFLTQMFKLDYQSGLNPAYTSPEQVRGEMPVVASDIYNLGCVLYFLLSGQQPFNGTDSFTVAMQHLQGAFPELPDGHCCRQLLTDMTRSGIDERLTTVQLVDEIQLLLDSEEIDHAQSLGEYANDAPISDGSDDGSTPQSIIDANLDFTARIEARLKEYSSVMTEPVESHDCDDENEVTDALEQFPAEGKSQIWRYLLILIIGILVGSGAYFLVIHKSVDPLPTQVIPVDDFSDRLDQALVAWQEAEVDDALIRLQDLVKQYPDDPRPINNLAAIYAAQGDYEQAREYLERALKTDANYATIYNNLASIYAEMARDSYGKALLIDQTRGSLQLVALSSQGGVEIGTPPQQIAANFPAVSESDEVAIPVDETDAITAQIDVVVADVVKDNVQEKANIVIIEAATVDNEEFASAEVIDAFTEPAAIESETVKPAAETSILPTEESAERFMHRWAKAWTDQDIVAYLACYDDEFNPPGGKTRIAWESQRQQRISKPNSINVTLIDLQVKSQDDGSIRFEAIQVYKSDVYSDKTHKVFNLHQVNDTWSILRERSFGSAQ